MKYIIPIATLTAIAVAATGFLVGHTTRPTETDPATTITAHCRELQRPDEPAGVIRDAWPGMTTCDKLAASATVYGPAAIAVRTAAESIREAQIDTINAAHPAADSSEARRTIQAIRSDLDAALDRYAVVAVGIAPTDYTQTR